MIQYLSIALLLLLAATHGMGQTVKHGSRIEVIAHRCLSDGYPENTLLALQRAIELRVDAVEIDIWRTTDDSLIVFHDRDTERLTGVKRIVPESSASELRGLSLPQDQRIPYLSEILYLLPPDMKIYIEIKCCWEPGRMGSVFPMLKREIDKRHIQSQVVIISFNPESLKESKAYMPNIPALLLGYEQGRENEMVSKAMAYGIDGLDVHYNLVNKTLLDCMKPTNLSLFIWTLDDPAKAVELVTRFPSIRGVTTNRPDAIKKAFVAVE